MSIINRLGSRIEVAVQVKRSTAVQHAVNHLKWRAPLSIKG